MQGDLQGWAPMWRRITRSPHWVGSSASTKLVMVFAVLHLRHTTTAATPAGSCDCTQDDIAREMEISVRSVRAGLRDLESTGFLKMERRQTGIRITVLGWRRWMVGSAIGDMRAQAQAPDRQPDRQPSPARSAPGADPSIVEEDQTGEEAIADAARRPLAPLAGFKAVIDAFHVRYLAAYGQPPTWGVKEGAQAKRLLKAHGEAEVLRRITVLFESPPRWMKPPYTWGTLVRNFDHLVLAGGGRGGGLTPEQLMARSNAHRGGRPH